MDTMARRNGQRTAEWMEDTVARLGRDPGGARLGALAAAAGVSPFHLQRSFRRWVGISPRQYAAFVQVCRAKGLLRAAKSVLDVALTVGASGPGRLHDHFCAVEAMSPGEDKALGAGVVVRHGRAGTPFGAAEVGWTARGICRLAFVGDAAAEGGGLAGRLAREWPRAAVVADERGARAVLARVFAADGAGAAEPLMVTGSAFQIAVWRALVEIPPGAVTTYGDLAATIGRPGSARAVGRAVGDNPVAWIIPCHRVIRATGFLGGYRWGLERKAGMLAAEIAETRAT
jgi:AraC family transcriptional regulator of adaptative response/methylated-DNA-[protein]-cysteine methyltransferase